MSQAETGYRNLLLLEEGEGCWDISSTEIPALPIIMCVTLGKQLDLSEPWCSPLALAFPP